MNIREKIVSDNLAECLLEIYCLNDWEKQFIKDIESKIKSRELKPSDLSERQFNTLHKIREKLRWIIETNQNLNK